MNKHHIKPIVINLFNSNYNDTAVKIAEEIEKYSIYSIGRTNITTCPVCFDTETTTFNEMAFIYIYQIQIGKYCILIREKSLFLKLLKEVHYICDDLSCEIIMGIANVKYEWSFLCKDFMFLFKNEETEIKSQVKTFLEPYTPLTSNIGNIRIIDILKISGSNLAKTAEDYCTTQKMVGDLDYKKIRNSKTKLTEKELKYCINDVVIGAEYLMYLHEQYTYIGKRIPLTSTGIVRNLMSEEAYLIDGDKQITKNDRLVSKFVYEEVLEKIKNGFPKKYSDYSKIMDKLYRGGVTHGNAFYAGEVLCEIDHIDYTSDYPACMLQYKYPVEFKDDVLIYNGKKITISKYENEEGLKKLLKYEDDLAFYATFTFKNLRSKYDHSLESISKTVSYSEDDCVIDNGRILRAKEVVVMLTEQDLISYKAWYVWDSFEVSNLCIGIKEELPWYVIKAIIESYCDKKRLKDEGKPYAAEKAILNSVYGCTVQRIDIEECRDDYNGEQIRHIKSPVPFEYLNLKNKNNSRYFDYIIQKLQKKYSYGLGDKEDNLRKAVAKVYNDIYNGNPIINSEKYLNIYNVIVEKLQQRKYSEVVNGVGSRIKDRNKTKMLSCFWGIWVTAYARRRLICMTSQLEEYAIEHDLKPVVVYYDTDSLFINTQGDKNIIKIVEDYNNETQKFNVDNLRIYENSGLLDDIGLFTFEPQCTHFKQLGAKRYVQRFYNKKTKKYIIEATIAGLNKKDFSKKVNKIRGDINKKFEVFSDGMIFNENECSKLTPTYINHSYSARVTDKYGNTEIMREQCGQVLKETSFEMTLCAFIAEKCKKRVG